MDPAISATLIGIMVTALLGVFAGAFHLLRSDLRDLRTENRDLRTENRADLQDFRTENRADLQHFRTENRADHRETNARIDRLEGKLDMLILALARAGFLVDPNAPQPSSDPQAVARWHQPGIPPAPAPG